MSMRDQYEHAYKLIRERNNLREFPRSYRRELEIVNVKLAMIEIHAPEALNAAQRSFEKRGRVPFINGTTLIDRYHRRHNRQRLFNPLPLPGAGSRSEVFTRAYHLMLKKEAR